MVGPVTVVDALIMCNLYVGNYLTYVLFHYSIPRAPQLLVTLTASRLSGQGPLVV